MIEHMVIAIIYNASNWVVDRIEFNNNVINRRHNVTNHTSRQTFCYHRDIQGDTRQIISELAGHEVLQMFKRYLHLGKDHKKSAVSNLEKG